jgi:hypothetical protein
MTPLLESELSKVTGHALDRRHSEEGWASVLQEASSVE